MRVLISIADLIGCKNVGIYQKDEGAKRLTYPESFPKASGPNGNTYCDSNWAYRLQVNSSLHPNHID